MDVHIYMYAYTEKGKVRQCHRNEKKDDARKVLEKQITEKWIIEKGIADVILFFFGVYSKGVLMNKLGFHQSDVDIILFPCKSCGGYLFRFTFCQIFENGRGVTGYMSFDSHEKWSVLLCFRYKHFDISNKSLGIQHSFGNRSYHP